jgi:septum formation protein
MIILASNSTTRAELLKSFGVKFIQKSASFDEDSLTLGNPVHFVYRATKGKMGAYLDKFGLKETPVLCADTIVTSRGEILRKAKDEDDAKRILKLQSGGVVSIITCMILKSKEREFIDLSSTDYLFDKFDEEKLNEYLKSGEWRGKAGACMVEGFCKEYIKEVRGYESTAMGLCVEKLLPYLGE